MTVRPGTRSLLRSGAVSTVVVVGYFTLPLRLGYDVGTAMVLAGGIVAVTVLLVLQVRSIAQSPYPAARAIGAMTITAPLFLVVFATGYFLLGEAEQGSWSEPMDRLDAMYFTVTVFATVGFGDIVAETSTARAVVLVQMVGNVVLIGLASRILVHAVQERRTPGGSPVVPGDGPTPTHRH